jgi:beta-RFAP synthase
MNAPSEVTVTTGARIHFGLLTHRPESGREFGGAGVMVDSPGWRISFSRAEADSIHASTEVLAAHPDCVKRAGQILNRLRTATDSTGPVAGVELKIASAIPAHQGLGSGSQLALAIACGFDQLTGGNRSVAELSRRAGRGGRSAIGTWGFDLGGLLVDGGKLNRTKVGAESGPAPLVARVDVPEEWRFLLLLPRESSGLSGEEEAAAFSSLAGMSVLATDRLCRLIVMQLVPAFREGCFDEAAEAIAEYGKVAGEYFAGVQGGLFTHPQMSEVAATLESAGATGLAQTSWGPGCAVLCRSNSRAEELARLARNSNSDWLDTQIVRGLNHGAHVESR